MKLLSNALPSLPAAFLAAGVFALTASTPQVATAAASAAPATFAASSASAAPASAASSPAALDSADHPRYRTVDIDGLRVFYREAGPSNAPVVLLLHGFPASSFMYRDLMERLAVRYRVLAPDYPGFGYSDSPSTAQFTYTFDRLADVVEKFTERLGLQRYALYMQDFGGPVGFRLAHRRPERVTALIIQNANAYEDGLPEEFWAPVRALWKEPTAANFDKIRALALADATLEWNYTHGVRDPQRVSPDNWFLQRALINRPGNQDVMLALLKDYGSNPPLYPGWQAYFRKHHPPTLITWGRNDEIFPAPGARAFLRDLPRAELHLLDTGHFALEDKVDEIARLTLDFLGRTQPRR